MLAWVKIMTLKKNSFVGKFQNFENLKNSSGFLCLPDVMVLIIFVK